MSEPRPLDPVKMARLKAKFAEARVRIDAKTPPPRQEAQPTQPTKEPPHSREDRGYE